MPTHRDFDGAASRSPLASLLGGLSPRLQVWLDAMWPSPARGGDDTLDIDTQALDSEFDGPVRVLVADDDPVNLMVISAMMASRGLTPLLAADGAEALALASELRFDLILMDLQMPVLDGFAATSAIRRFELNSTRPAVPVVAHSSMFPGAHVLAERGFNGSLAKPCDAQELDDCLLQWCPTYRPAPATPRVTNGADARR